MIDTDMPSSKPSTLGEDAQVHESKEDAKTTAMMVDVHKALEEVMSDEDENVVELGDSMVSIPDSCELWERIYLSCLPDLR